MPVETDTLLDRIKLKTQLNRWRGLAILALIVAALAVMFQTQTIEAPGKYIARINVSGIIEQDEYRAKTLRKLAENKAVQAVILHINSPGGTVVGGEELYETLKELAAKKPLVSVIGTMGTSAAYMTALPTEQIFARQGSVTGSIGVIFYAAQFSELAKKVGVDVTIVRTAPLKGVPSPFEPVTPEIEASIRSVINDFYDAFLGMLIENRKLNREEALALADGRIYTGQQALENKLIDAIGGEKEALAWLRENKNIAENVGVKDVSLKKNAANFEQLFSSIVGDNLLMQKTFSLQGLLSIWQGAMMGQ